MLYRGMDRAALDAAYNNTAAVGNAKRDAYVAGWTVRSDALRKSRPVRLDQPYGDGARQRIDMFSCGTPGAPTLVYIHGGYWQIRQSEEYAAAWTKKGLRGHYLPVAKHDHFSILEELAQPHGVIFNALREMATTRP